MAIPDVQSAIEIYNYASFMRSESAGKSSEFKNTLRVGEEAPDFELPAIEGGRISLSAFRGKLSNAPYKRYVEIGEGTHHILMEKNRMQLFQAVQQFLDERLKPNQ